MPTNTRKPTTPRKPLPPALSQARPPKADLDVSKLILTGKYGNKKLSTQLQQAITSCTVEATIEGAGTLTLAVTDWAEGMLHSQLIKGSATLVFDAISYTLSKIARQDTIMTLTFEETAVSLLRLYDKPKKADRANGTRAQFVRSMVKEVTQARIPFQCPEVNAKQPIAKPTAASRVRVQRWPISL